MAGKERKKEIMGKWAGKMRDSWMKWIDTRFADRMG